MREYRSVYAPLIVRYIEFKRGLGYLFKEESAFVLFDRFAIENGMIFPVLTETLCDKWNAARPNESHKTRANRLSDIRHFIAFLVNLGYKTCVPKAVKVPQSTFTPYIFSNEEINGFLAACDKLDITPRAVANHTFPALFRLLYGCGLRLSEALSLKIRDVNLDKGTILICEPKNMRDRKLPLSGSLLEVMIAYHTRYAAGYSDDEYFFQNKRGGKVTGRTTYHWFRILLRRAGIAHSGRGEGPRIHDLRHTFSVYSMAQMSREGLDLYYCLPILSNYLGHKSVEATEMYVRLTSMVFPELISKANNVYGFVFPEVILP
ncbi:MAG: tyrosine-type recombinase/integrase [Defluviitaleaceae bacterium]|nr:tyrosine-type recombinase/integrase [Defluviitaleaceae bacterium]